MKPLLHKNEIPARIDDKTTIFIPAGQDIEKAKQNFLQRLKVCQDGSDVPGHARAFNPGYSK